MIPPVELSVSSLLLSSVQKQEQTPSFVPVRVQQEWLPEKIYLYKKLGSMIYAYQVRNTPDLKSTIRKLLIDKSLREQRFVKEGKYKKSIPKQFYLDYSRFDYLKLNNHFLFDSRTTSHLSGFKIVRHMMHHVGKKAFEGIATLVQQAFMADLINQLMSSIKRDPALEEVHVIGASGYRFAITTDKKYIQVDGKLLVAVKAEFKTYPFLIGYFAVYRRISLPRQELEESFEDQEETKILPSLKVFEAQSNLYLTKQEAWDNLNGKSLTLFLKSLF